jgi:two-component system, LuxR family, response regulator FixJ
MSDVDTSSVTVFLVDDEQSVTEGLAWLLDSVKIVSRPYASASAFFDALRQLDGPACAVVDLRMPEMSGLELQKHLAETGHDIPIVFLTAHGDIPAAVTAMQGGAIDFVQKPFNPDQFLTSVRRAIRMAAERHAQRMSDREVRDLLARLSARELDVLEGLLDGQTSKEIAIALDISPKTVDVHRANIVKKLGVGSSAELVRLLGRRVDLRQDFNLPRR